MADIGFEINLEWSGTGREGEGRAQFSEHGLDVTYAAPEAMGGKGSGPSPEEFLMAGVSTCYSSTLFGLLRKQGLPVANVSIRVEGKVTGYPMTAKFSLIRVHPEIRGGNPDAMDEYVRVANEARDKCFIGKTIAGNVEYQVGNVFVKASANSAN